MKIPSKMLKAAQVCQAKCDIRYYLNGIHIKGSFVESTNGYVCVRMSMKKPVRKERILNINGVVPKKAHESEFVFGKSESIVKHRDSKGQLLSIHVVEVIEGKYPDISRVMPDVKKKLATEQIGLNTDYINMFGKMFGDRHSFNLAKFEFFGESSSVKITSVSPIVNEDYGSPVFIVMPGRLS
ncbi:DNA polymerase III beta subunit [Shewanella sp. phage 1/41]|uniref:RusA-like Holliday junction resolvase n=1 Tax=Shewanella sp. phage 1/41 TaxID=1458861 RepID=UPI0004F6927D|nr:RusA-like Holliday junction resolvase [Shewanella sp. phage 1/41]AHK11689.1 DNA polymerase III beta subunit [Shewanella sp. phage 1/41]